MIVSKSIQIQLDTSSGEPLIKMTVGSDTYIQLTVKSGILAAAIAAQLVNLGAKDPILGVAFDYAATVAQNALVVFEPLTKAPVGLYLREEDFVNFHDAFNL
ncbi:MAG: hypothetical protein K9M11_01845 [Candidatus Pacebacteria bacterium]|nr:hypothetical protein [Candidatus Paceibacterota bacterium]